MFAEIFINARIGLPYRRGAEGPDAFDCYGLTRLTQRELFDRELPVVQFSGTTSLRDLLQTFSADVNRLCWKDLAVGDVPADGDVVTMSKSHEEHHIGTWFAFDGGGVFHAIENIGVCYDTRTHLEMQGWRRFRFYRWCAA